MRNPYDMIGRIGLLLAIVGAVNWLLVGLFEWNAVQWIFTESGTQTVSSLGERIVYIVVGVGGVVALPMLAATLARSRRAEHEESSRESERGHERSELTADDTDFYLGAPKHAHAEERSDLAAASAESRPVRKTERVIIRTEEPIVGSTETETASETVSPEPLRSSSDRDLRYGSVEEADDEYREEERRAA